MLKMRDRRYRQVLPRLLLLCIIIIYLINAFHYSAVQSITSDEGSFYNYAARFLKGKPERIDPRSDNSKMPVIVINTIPRIIKQKINPAYRSNDYGLHDIMQGRKITVLVSVFIILMVFVWASELYGKEAGLFAAFLMAFCPNNLAASTLITTDSYSALFLLSTLYFLWKFLTSKRFPFFLVFCLMVALSQLVKQSLFHLYILVPLIIITWFIVNRPVIKARTVLKYLVPFILINLVIINAGYYFFGTGYQLGNYRFMSGLFTDVQKMLPASTPVPFPKPFVDGLDMAKYYDQLGGGYNGVSSFGKVTILGKSATGGSFWYYYFVTIFFKTPIVYFIFFGWSVFILSSRLSLKGFISNEFILIIPVIYYLVVFSFFYKTQCGIRHIIFIFPFIFILSAAFINHLYSRGRKILVALLSVCLVTSVLFYRNNFYAYTNEFIIDKTNAFTKVGAGNLEFLQAGYFYKDYLKEHPDVKWVPERPSPGIFLMTSEDYLDVWNRHKYDWIGNAKPFATVMYSGLLIRVTENDLNSRR